ncbi:prepilin-type N-terminal cleavage/methylation domain-containing protein [Clostridium sp. 19966]|uniref:PilW family protein n=1 Tax=Clostridium sp. 19966 TaxID=2768166 RepID=UPI0028DDAAF8|nr:prepilin-type N-terminal cleavage/methylation domain-containing protein [Clostridium sp. 19966]MDT8715478.1 prepilin-type N-terminal cleavage/methylation domain-containing protein [Clostridium sp. 19966]
MKELKKVKKGFTLIELFLALALMSTILAIIFSFYIPHQKALNDTASKSQLQMDAQTIMQYFSKSALEASRISSLNSITDTALLNSKTGEQNVSELTFSVDDTAGNSQYTYQYAMEGQKLKYTDSKVSNAVLAEDVNYIKITPIDKSIGECSGVSIKLELITSDGKIKYDVNNDIYFRNKN